ncbi:sugar glycosyltransferase [Sodalis-like endosymbiont of Proechinophthirus fluctus]|uniref:sugar glycosyltransferase n=1 Tax=Sodalis-like endosymbiont of Proechinophthirus fluctus TaxID=1462730 RepID=UPI0007A8FCAE|nr:sugar glycosyltransferase [Sodalis-like endosymbiont of Proechinophthirus fluctus]KYP95945.1 sugar glycosyltransferase [Sodalis-like endosymbiont of Proechinophthirus fluctus]
MSTFFKQIYRYTRPRSYRHNENLWPFCRITHALTGDITQLRYKGQLVPLVPLTDWHHRFSGDALITATGLSINEMDFAGLPAMTVVGVNGAYALKDRLDFQLYIIVDMSFIDRRTDVLRAIIADPTLTLFTTLHGIARIIDRFTLPAVRCRLALIEDACYRIYQPRVPGNGVGRHFGQDPHIRFNPDYPDIAFTTDIRNGIFDAGTVVFWALQILLYLGFTRLYIAGLDMTNFHQPRFYESDYDKLPSFLAEKFTSVIVPAFTLAREVLQQNGVEVKNLSLNSALCGEIFEKVSFDDTFQD